MHIFRRFPREKLMLRGSFDKRLRIELPVPLPVTAPPTPSLRDTNKNSHASAKITPGKSYPLVSARFPQGSFNKDSHKLLSTTEEGMVSIQPLTMDPCPWRNPTDS